MATNDITGDRIASKMPSKAYAENYDHIDKTWRKHDGSKGSPVPPDTMVKLETATPNLYLMYLAREINWLSVKWYSVVGSSTLLP